MPHLFPCSSTQCQNDLWYEKKLQREEEAEKKVYGETEKFVTPAYKKHLEELRSVVCYVILLQVFVQSVSCCSLAGGGVRV
jgi:hypothetical protein